MFNSKSIRFTVTALIAGLALAAPAIASACEDGKGKGAHFQKADKNSDGFLTQPEVGAERWERIKVADANDDAKVSKEEMKQARKDGKLGKHGKRRGHGKDKKKSA